MKGKLVKRSNGRFDLYKIEDKNQINTIASSFDNPKGKLSLKNCEAFDAGHEMLDSPKNYNDVLNSFKESLQHTEWDVEIVMEKDCYSSAGRCDNSTMADCIICTPVTYLKDADGCLILKRI